MLGQTDTEARERLASLTRMIAESPALLAREQQILAGYTRSLAGLLADEADAGEDDIRPSVAAGAMMGAHRALLDYARARIVAGVPHARLAREVRARAEEALGLLEAGFGDYAVKSAARPGTSAARR